MKQSHARFALSIDELIEEAGQSELSSLWARAAQAQFFYCRMLPADRATFRKLVLSMPQTGQPLFNRVHADGTQELNRFEFTRRVGLLLDRARAAVEATSEKPRRHPDRGGWKPLRQPTPGRHSGAQKERDAGW